MVLMAVMGVCNVLYWHPVLLTDACAWSQVWLPWDCSQLWQHAQRLCEGWESGKVSSRAANHIDCLPLFSSNIVMLTAFQWDAWAQHAILFLVFQLTCNLCIAISLRSVPLCSLRQSSFPLWHSCHRLVLEGPLFQNYFAKVEVSNFEVASDAFSTFKASQLCCWHLSLTECCLPVCCGSVSPCPYSFACNSRNSPEMLLVAGFTHKAQAYGCWLSEQKLWPGTQMACRNMPAFAVHTRQLFCGYDRPIYSCIWPATTSRQLMYSGVHLMSKTLWIATRWSHSSLFLQFFASYTNLLKSSNYVTRRQSLKVRHSDWTTQWSPENCVHVFCEIGSFKLSSASSASNLSGMHAV